MADIVNPEVIRFTNESIRPVCEQLRALSYTMDDIKRKWDASIAPAISANDFADVIADGRASEGVSILTKNDITLVMVQVNSLLTALSGVGVMNVIQKPCVRGLAIV